MISKGERTELKAVVRNQFKVLRAEVEQRKAELFAEVESDLRTRYAEDDQRWHALNHQVHEITLEANRRVNDALREHGYGDSGSNVERMYFDSPTFRQPKADETQLRRLAHSRINEQVKAAGLTLDRQEADLLRTLAIGALESAEAHAFVAAIPTVGELVSGARLAELEASLASDDDA